MGRTKFPILTQALRSKREFNELVNMTPGELEEWLICSMMSTYAGHSGRKFIEILKKNPKRDPSRYDEEDLGHMRKVVSCNKRHLAQEEKAKHDTQSKSYKSLKNWGHDAQKT